MRPQVHGLPCDYYLFPCMQDLKAATVPKPTFRGLLQLTGEILQSTKHDVMM